MAFQTFERALRRIAQEAFEHGLNGNESDGFIIGEGV